MGSQSRQHQAMDAQVRQAIAMERIADALERLANMHAPVLQPPNTELHYDNGLEALLDADVPPEGYVDGE